VIRYLRHFFIFALLCVASQAFTLDFPQPVKTEIVAEETGIQPGRPFWVAVQLDIDEGWHAYWKNPGMNGFPPTIEWNLPEGFVVGESRWPTPERLEKHEGVSYGYHDVLVLLTEITPPSEISGDQVELEADLKWLVCSETTCLPGFESLSLSLPVKTPQIDHSVADLFTSAREKSPLDQSSLLARVDGSAVHLDMVYQGTITHAYFYPEETGVIDDKSPVNLTSQSDSHQVSFEVQESDLVAVKGILVLHNGDNVVKAIQVNHPLQAVSEEIAMTDVGVKSISQNDAFAFKGGVIWALIFAFVGGLILNLMPCVLPVISLKIFSFVKMAGESRWQIMKHGLMFTLGVLVSFWALAGVLITLQAYGQMAGWGFQLQEPIFVAILAVIIYVFALSLFGVFEFGTMFSSWAGQKQSDATKESGGGMAAFLSGVLATAVATPCTGPFLGPAIGFALTLSAPYALMIFTALALGMSSPYLLISVFPSMIRFLPKPGKWMIVFKEILGFFMVATALWLVSVFGWQTDLPILFKLITGLFFLTFACWVWGKWGTPLVKRPIRITATIATLAIAVSGLYCVVTAARTEPAQNELVAMADIELTEHNIRQWIPFSSERLDDLRAQGKPVLVDFTAKWCLICQSNHLVLDSQAVSDKCAELGVVKMLADWTRSDPAISKVLREYGRSGVPLYLLFNGDGEPEVLPQTLTPDMVLEYLSHINEKAL